VTKGLDPEAPMKDSGVEWLGEIPEQWKIEKTNYIYKIGSGTTPSSENLEYYGEGVPWVTTSELRETRITETEKSVTKEAINEYSSLKVYPNGSLILAMYGATIGRIGLLDIPASVNQACCVFYNGKGIDRMFMYYWFQMRRAYLITLGLGGGQPNLSQDLLRSIRIPLPDLFEQKRIARYLGRETAKLDALVAKVESAVVLLKEYRVALISAAVTGKIDLREE
jgi:type I restriction enzyme S subunit